jgi:very-short-patch-repair endonuclease
MIFISISGKQRKLKNSIKYLIKWNGPCRSKIQKKVKDLLHKHWFADIVFEELPVLGTKMTLDFYNANKKTAIEVDGSQHYKYNKFFHGNSRQKFLDQLKRDEAKEFFCEVNNIKLVRILDTDILNEELLKKLELL